MLRLEQIRTDGDTQPRDQMNWVVVSEYAADMGEGATFPPVVVFYDGSDYWLADGFHRVEAAKLLGLVEIAADVRPGTLEDARWYSYSANKLHGLRRSNEDKKRAVVAALAHPKARTLTDVEIARHVGVSSMTVGNYRRLIIKDFNDDIRTITRNGSTYTMNTANIGQRPIAREFYDNPATWQVSETAYHPPSVDAEEDEEWTEQAQYEYDLGVAKAAQAAGFDVILPEPPQSKPHVAYNAGNNEWYTPPEYIAAAIEVMGGIDLDPATTPKANEVVGATRIYTADDDGLFYPWQGRVWMNPPYASELVGKFASKLAQHVQTGDVTDAIVLVNNATETGWFYTLTSVASAVVFPKGRVRFWEPNGAISAPLQGQAVVYIGPRPDLFLNAYRQFGWGATLWQHN
jgi:hypothetical protein